MPTGKRGRCPRQKRNSVVSNQVATSSPQHAAEKITRYLDVSPKPVASGSSTPASAPKTGGTAPTVNNAATCTELFPGILTPEGTPTKALSVPLPQDNPSPDRTLPYPLEGDSAGGGASHDQEPCDLTGPSGGALEAEGASSLSKERTNDVQSGDNSSAIQETRRTNRLLAEEPSGTQTTPSSKGASRSLQGQMEEAGPKKSRKGRRGKKSGRAGAKTSNMKAPSKARSKEESTMKTMKDFFPVRRSDRRCKSILEAERKLELEEAILSNKEEGIKVEEILGKGRGVVSSKAFRRGDFVVEYYGDLIDLAAAKEREGRYTANPSVGCYMYYFEHKNKSYCIDATMESGRLGRLLNHSRCGNCCTKLVDIGERPHLILVARQDIDIGEELVYDYGDRNKDTIRSHPWLAL